MDQIRNFLYRSPRFRAECPMDFIFGESVLLGNCSNLSESGLLGRFAHPVAVGTEGMLTLYCGQDSVRLKARVDSPQADEVRLHFLFDHEADQMPVRGFLQRLLAQA